MNDLIGKKFRRNKYGLSIWEDEIIEIYYIHKWIKPFDLKTFTIEKSGQKIYREDIRREIQEQKVFGFIPIPMVKGKKTICPFELSEIIIYP